jgi:hypothetical protein
MKILGSRQGPQEDRLPKKKDPLSPSGGYGGSGCFEPVG